MSNQKILLKNRHGFSLVSISIMLGIILAFGLVLLSYSIYSQKTSIFYSGSISAVQIAEAGIEKAEFCLNSTSGDKCGGTYGTSYVGETDVDFSGGNFTIAISGSGSTRTITVEGTDAKGNSKTVIADVTTIPSDDAMSWGYALQAGGEGIYMENNAEVTGSIYSNGNILCQGTQAIIDGDAYSALDGGRVDGCTVNYHAHADQVLNSDVGGDAYYESDPSGISGSTVVGTEYPGSATPDPQSIPDLDEETWKTGAEAGGVINGDYAPSDGETLGPKKINGDLTLSQNVDIIIAGPIWVVGNIYTENNSTMTLDSSFGAYGTVIIADHPGDPTTYGKIQMVPNSGVFGSGNPKSHILLVATNNSIDPDNPALDVSNNADGAVFLAENGVLKLNNNASAKSMAAKYLYLDNNASVSYLESEMSDMNFSNSPSGVWGVLEGSWREAN